MDNAGNIQISVIVCTHNRAASLARTLQSLVLQSLDPRQYEIIVVDNASTDSTRTVVEKLTAQLPNLRYVAEPRLGHSGARNAGIRVANGQLIAFLDDDEEADPHWLHHLTVTFDQVTPTPSCIGGRIFPNWEGTRPEWLPDCLMPYLAIIDWGDVPRWLSFPREYAVGGNMAFVKKDLMEQGGFNASLGRIGNCLLSNDELFPQHKLRIAGKGIYYQPNACVRHLVPRSRLTRTFLIKRAYWQGISDSVLSHALSNSSNRNGLGNLKWRLQQCLKNGFLALKASNQREMTRYLVESVRSLGAAFQEVTLILNRQISSTHSDH